MRLRSIYYWLLMLVMALLTGACEDSNSNSDDLGDLIEVPSSSEDVWVSADGISDDDLLLIVDLSVKMEYIKVQFVKMLSNNFEGSDLFCGTGPKTDPDPTMNVYTALMVKEEEYIAAMERLEENGLFTPTTSTWWNNTKKYFDAMKKENQRAEAVIKDNLHELYKEGKYDNVAQQQLYDYYKEMEPQKAAAIGAKDAREFFTMLNNGELTAYASNIRHIWCDTSPDQDKKYERVGDFNSVSFTGHNEQLGAAYRVSSEQAVALGEMYLTGVDKLAGGYGSKIIEWGETVENKIKMLDFVRKALKGDVDWQQANKFIVDHYAGKIKDAMQASVSEDFTGITEELINDAVDKVISDITDQLVAKSAKDADPNTEEGKKQLEAMSRAADGAVIDIFSNFSATSSSAKIIYVTDDITGKMSIGFPDKEGRLTVVTTTGSKTITVIDSYGNRLTKKFTAKEGYNTVNINSKGKPYLTLNPSSVSLKGTEDYTTTYVHTNCKYVKLRFTKKESWFEVKRDSKYNSAIQLIVSVNANDTGKPRSGSVIVEGYDDNASDAKPVATATLTFTQGLPLEGSVVASPPSLTFEAAGGSQTVQLTIEKLGYYGGYVDAASSDWLSVTTGANDQLVVTAKANTTGEERTGTVYAYGCDIPNPSMDDIIATPIPVTQKAGSGIGDYEVTQIDFEPDCYLVGLEGMLSEDVFSSWRRAWYNGSSYVNDQIKDEYHTHSEEISVTKKNGGNTLHIEGKYNHYSKYTGTDFYSHKKHGYSQPYRVI